MTRQIVAILVVGALAHPVMGSGETASEASAWQRAQGAVQAGEWATAVEAYREHLATSPEDAWSWFALGALLHGQEDFEASQKAFELCLEAQVSVPSVARYNLAASLARQGKTSPAVAQLEESLAGGFFSGEQLLEDPDFEGLPEGELRRLSKVADEFHRPCLHKPEYEQFDFWLGTWDVRIPSGFRAARDEVVRSEDGCVITQTWVGTLGNTGRSYTTYDATQEQWTQLWIGSGGLAGTMSGNLQDGAMVLTGAAVLVPGAIARSAWVPQPDGTVRLKSERSEDGGKTWIPTGDLTYHPVDGGS